MNDLRQRAATHEASHAVACLCLGIPIVRVTLQNDRPHLRRGYYRQRAGIAVQAMVIMALAGPVGEAHFFGAANDGSDRTDFAMARSYLADAGHDPLQIEGEIVHRAPPLYVYTSSRSRHTRNMMETAKASVMFIEDEAWTRNYFARKRFTCQCSVESVGREATEWRTVMSLFKRKFGKVFDMIRPLPDFVLFRLIPDGGVLSI